MFHAGGHTVPPLTSGLFDTVSALLKLHGREFAEEGSEAQQGAATTGLGSALADGSMGLDASEAAGALRMSNYDSVALFRRTSSPGNGVMGHLNFIIVCCVLLVHHCPDMLTVPTTPDRPAPPPLMPAWGNFLWAMLCEGAMALAMLVCGASDARPCDAGQYMRKKVLNLLLYLLGVITLRAAQRPTWRVP